MSIKTLPRYFEPVDETYNGGYLPPFAEVFTSTGRWKRLDALEISDSVAQINCYGEAEFSAPTEIGRVRYAGPMVHYQNQQRNYQFLCTLPYLHDLWSKYKNGTEKLQILYAPQYHQIMRTCVLQSKGLNYSDDVMELLIMQCCRCLIRDRRTGLVSFQTSRQDLMTDFRDLMYRIDIAFFEKAGSKREFTCFQFNTKEYWSYFPDHWLPKLSSKQRELVLRLLSKWSGGGRSTRPGQNYFDSKLENCEWIQTLCHLSGITCTIQMRDSSNAQVYQAVVSPTITKTSIRCVQPEAFTYKAHDELLSYITVTQGRFLVRFGNSISIASNTSVPV